VALAGLLQGLFFLFFLLDSVRLFSNDLQLFCFISNRNELLLVAALVAALAL